MPRLLSLAVRLAPLCCGLFVLMAADDSCTINIGGGDDHHGHHDECVDRADVCPSLACEVFATDQDGCEICECEETPPTGCTTDSECGPDEVCAQTEVCPPCGNEDPACLMPCTISGECVPAQLTCANVRCEPGSVCAESMDGPVCIPTGYCQTDAECGPDSVCNTWDYCINPACDTDPACDAVCTHGMCEPATTGDCLTDEECGSGFHCELTCGGPVNLVACPRTGQCIADAPVCYSDDGCDIGQHCSVSDGDCRPDPTCPDCEVCSGVCLDNPPAGCSDDTQCGPNEVCLIACAECACVDTDGDGVCENDPAACGCTGVCVDRGGTCVDEGDLDGDGYSECNGDCNNADASVHPGAVELQDGLDNDCNGVVDDVTTPGECRSDADCGPGQACQTIYPPCACLDSNGDGICENDLANCAPSNVCVDVDPQDGCYSDADCPDGRTCNAADVCLPPPGCAAGQNCLAVCYGTCNPAI